MVIIDVLVFFIRYMIFPVVGALGTGTIFAAKRRRDAEWGMRLGLYLGVLSGYLPHFLIWRRSISLPQPEEAFFTNLGGWFQWIVGGTLPFPLPKILTWGDMPLSLFLWLLPMVIIWIILGMMLPEGDDTTAPDRSQGLGALLRHAASDLQWVDLVIDVLRILIIEMVFIGSFNTLISGRITGAQWFDLLVAGLAQGSIYALIALGYTLVYGILLMINFAHGEVFMAGALTSVFLAQWMSRIGFLNGYPLLAIPILILFAGFISMTIAILLERIAYRPLRGAPRLVPLITAIGASFFLQYTFRGFFGSAPKSYPDVDILKGDIALFGSLDIPAERAFVFIAALGLMGGLYLLVERTKIGKAMRAVSEDKEVARLMGVDIDFVIMFTFALGGWLAGAAGVINGLFRPQGIFFFMGFRPGIKAFTAAVLGGIGSVPGAMLGGLFLGVIEAVGPNLVLAGLGIEGANQLQDVIAFTMLVLVLIFRPQGIMGEKLTEKKA